MVSSEESDADEGLGVREEGNEMLTFNFHVLIFLGVGGEQVRKRPSGWTFFFGRT